MESSHPSCPFSTIGADITIAHTSTKAPSFDISADAISLLLANVNKHLQRFERKKLLRNKMAHTTLQHIIRGEDVIQELLNKNMVLLPFAIDPFGKWGPIT
jgi:hypothetical protein